MIGAAPFFLSSDVDDDHNFCFKQRVTVVSFSEFKNMKEHAIFVSRQARSRVKSWTATMGFLQVCVCAW